MGNIFKCCRTSEAAEPNNITDKLEAQHVEYNEMDAKPSIDPKELSFIEQKNCLLVKKRIQSK